MILNIGLLLVGFLALIKGADYFVDGAASIASSLKIPSVVVGLTIVAFGTSAPEAAVSVTAALNHSNAIAISNVIGSNIFNLIVVLGTTAVITLVPVPRSILRKEFPFLIAVSFLMAIFVFTGYSLSRLEGIIFLLLIVGYVAWLVKDALAGRATIEVEKPSFTLPISILLIGIGIFGIIFGGDLVVNNAKAIALTLGLSEKLVGLTIVSIGTSLPELVTSVVAAKKGNVEIAVGNVVGSNIFNILFILGLSATITPIPVEVALMFDLIIMLVATLLCFFVAKRNEKISKKEGILFLLLFVVYLTYIIIRN